jgi:DNA-directed RNA polymerase sigma subunit (sigma70/sigma32)
MHDQTIESAEQTLFLKEVIEIFRRTLTTHHKSDTKRADRYLRVFLSYHMEGKTFSEIGKEMGGLSAHRVRVICIQTQRYLRAIIIKSKIENYSQAK